MISFSKVATLVMRFLRSDFGAAFIITIGWKIFMLLIGYLFDLHNNPDGFLEHTLRWDGNWYAIIINDGYTTNAASAVFYPLFPLLVSTIHSATFGIIDILSAGQIINTISVWFMIAAILKIGGVFFKEKSGWLVALVLTAPTAFFLHVFYTEALFMAIGFWAYVFALQRRWLFVGILLALLTSVRLPALLFIGLCGLEFARVYKWKIKKMFNRNLFYFLLAPIGFIAYGTYLSITRSDFFGMFHAYHATTDWIYQVFDINFIKTILRAVFEILRAIIGERPLDNDIIINHLLPVVALFLAGGCSIYLLLRARVNDKYIPLGIFGLASIMMFTLNSNVVSAHRYILPCLTIYIAILIFKGKHQNALLISICSAGLIIQLALFSLFIDDVFVG